MNEMIIEVTGQSNNFNSTITANYNPEYTIQIVPQESICELIISNTYVASSGSGFDPSANYYITGTWGFSELVTFDGGITVNGNITTAAYGTAINWYAAYQHSQIVVGNPHNTTLNDLTDVVITTPVANQVLLYSGTGWINSTLDPSLLNYWVKTGVNLNYTLGDVKVGTGIPSTKFDVDGVITATGGNSTYWNLAYTHSQIAGGDSVHVSTTENTQWDAAYTHSLIAGGDSIHVSTTENTQWDSAYTHSLITSGNPHGVTDATILFSDIVTNNASVINHGFLPKLEGDTSKYLRSDGSWFAISLSVGDFLDAVIRMVIDNSFDPGATPTTGDRYICETVTLHANFGTIAGLGIHDVVQYDGADFIVSYDSSAATAPATVTVGIDKNGASNHDWTYDTTSDIWVDRGTTTLHNSLSDINTGNYLHLTASEYAKLANWDTAYTHSQDNSQAHSDYLINNGDDTTSGIITAAGFTTAGQVVSTGTANNSFMGNTGFGINVPSYKLHIEGATTVGDIVLLYLKQTDTNPNSSTSIILTAAGTANRSVKITAITNGSTAGNGHSLAFFTSIDGQLPNEKMRITSNGYVGIGTNVPEYLLSVGKRNTVKGSLLLSDSANGAGAGAELRWDMLVAGGYPVSQIAMIKPYTYRNGGNALDFYVGSWNNNNDVGSIKMTIHSNGSVGIGTAEPIYLLHLKKDVNSSTIIYIDNQDPGTSSFSGLDLASANGALHLYNFSSAYSTASRTGAHEINSNAANGLRIVSTNGCTIQNTLSSTVFSFSVQDGKVGMGIKTPVSTAHIYESTTSTGTATGLTIEQSSTGDVQLQYLLTGAQRWVTGIDNSDSDSFKIGRGADWATGVDIKIATNGAITLGSLTGYIKGATGALSASATIPITDITGTRAQYNASASDGDFMWIGDAPTSHTHGSITNAGYLGSTANLPLITGTGGLISVGSFGTTVNTFCIGNDSRLSDARTPLSHTHGNITNGGLIGVTALLPIITGTGGILQAGSFGTSSGTFCQGNDSRLSDARTPTAHQFDSATYHTISGKTAGQILLATAATTYAFTTISNDATISGAGVLTLKNTGTTGTYKSVTTDAQGRVTSGTNPSTLSGFGITDAYTKTEVNAGFVYKDYNVPNGFNGNYLTFAYDNPLIGVYDLDYIAYNKSTDKYYFNGNTGAFQNTSATAAIVATSFQRQDGSSSQFLKADGSVDSNAYVTQSHAHGNITSDGKIGSTATLPIITTTAGLLTTGSFSNTAGTFCQGNDSRLSDNRTPVAHQLDSATYHTISGKTTGHFLKATSATTFAFSAHGLTPNDVIDTFDALTQASPIVWASSNENVTIATTATYNTINITGATTGMSGMAYITTTGCTISLQMGGNASYIKVDSNANLTLVSGNIYMLTWICISSTLILANLAEYTAQ